MTPDKTLNPNPLVSVIIPCYNHAQFLAEAIESVHQQTYRNIEIIVVDDGSKDNTKEIVGQFTDVKYIYQHNRGLSAARNTGIDHSKGEFLVFLDADDLLYPNAIEINIGYLLKNETLAFVSGWHDKVDEWKYPIAQDAQQVIESNHYLHLLMGNYIGMHAAVMYRRKVFDKFRYDTSLKACEDYNLYFDITRKYPVASHNTKMAAYRIHGVNMSANVPFMLKHVLFVLERQKPRLLSNEERQAFNLGKKIWKDYYSEKIYWNSYFQITLSQQSPAWKDVKFIIDNNTKLALKLTRQKFIYDMREFLKKYLPDGILKWLHKKGIYEQYNPPIGRIDSGDFQRTKPFSADFGFDRGGPIDRYYIEAFLQKNNADVKGRALEIGDNEYTLRYGGNKLTKSDILHITENPKATFIGDLSDAPQLPAEAFDCVILTQTLHFIYDFKAALRTCYRVLKPEGVLLLTVPGISHIDSGEWKEYWLWAFTDKSMKRIMAETFPSSTVEIETFGNVYVASSFLYGMGLPEMNKKYLDQHDPSYQVIITVKATKPAK
jgi:glycosyltransferase involved in cell wall biosynthesis/SAM-dependent methyltransferase